MKFPSCLFASEAPFDGGSVVVEVALPGIDFLSLHGQIRNSPPSQALTAEHAHFDLRLAEPTAMVGCLMNGEAVPQQAAQFLTVPFW